MNEKKNSLRGGKGKAMTARERELVRRCVVLMTLALFFFVLAAVRARSGEYVGGGYAGDRWRYYEDDDWDTMADDDYVAAARLRKQVLGQNPGYFRRKATRIHDSVTIVINESTASELTSSNDLKRDTSTDWTLSNWLTPSFSGGLGTTQHGTQAGGNTPQVTWSGARRHKSDSSIERTQAFSTTLTGEVIDVKPNGYLEVQARKTVNVNGEVQTVTLTGLVNPSHMDSNSAISAEYIIDMRVGYTGKGPMTRMDKRGWGAKIMDFLSPF